MRIGEIIKQKRNELGITQEELAAKIHVTRQAISNWENNKSVPDIEFVRQLASEFHLSIDEMLINDVKMIEKKSRVNSILIFVTIVAVGFLYWSVYPQIPFTKANENIGICSAQELNYLSIKDLGEHSYSVSFNDILHTNNNYYCVPVQLTVEIDVSIDKDISEKNIVYVTDWSEFEPDPEDENGTIYVLEGYDYVPDGVRVLTESEFDITLEHLVKSQTHEVTVIRSSSSLIFKIDSKYVYKGVGFRMSEEMTRHISINSWYINRY